jgi:hypothetical protein
LNHKVVYGLSLAHERFKVFGSCQNVSLIFVFLLLGKAQNGAILGYARELHRFFDGHKGQEWEN